MGCRRAEPASLLTGPNSNRVSNSRPRGSEWTGKGACAPSRPSRYLAIPMAAQDD
jgi:hypothetical protein